MARPKNAIPTERLCVTLPAPEVKAAKAAASKAGVTWADFVRQALASQAAVEKTRPSPGPLKSRRPNFEKAVRAAVLTPVEQYQLHEHVAGSMLSGGIHRCSVKGCEARKVGGRWIEGP